MGTACASAWIHTLVKDGSLGVKREA
jgi:hypothetical protein